MKTTLAVLASLIAGVALGAVPGMHLAHGVDEGFIRIEESSGGVLLGAAVACVLVASAIDLLRRAGRPPLAWLAPPVLALGWSVGAAFVVAKLDEWTGLHRVSLPAWWLAMPAIASVAAAVVLVLGRGAPPRDAAPSA